MMIVITLTVLSSVTFKTALPSQCLYLSTYLVRKGSLRYRASACSANVSQSGMYISCRPNSPGLQSPAAAHFAAPNRRSLRSWRRLHRRNNAVADLSLMTASASKTGVSVRFCRLRSSLARGVCVTLMLGTTSRIHNHVCRQRREREYTPIRQLLTRPIMSSWVYGSCVDCSKFQLFRLNNDLVLLPALRLCY